MMKKAIIIFAIVEFIVTAFIVHSMWGK